MAINGTLAGDTGIYPQIDVQYKWKICNFDDLPDNNYSLKLLSGDKSSSFRVWANKTVDHFTETLSSDITLEPYNSGSGSDENCVSLTRNDTIDTEIGNWYISTKFEGHPYVDENRVLGDPYCYAYAFNPIRVSYGPCTMSVSTE